MKLQLHFLEATGPFDRPELVMSQFWPNSECNKPVTVTYGRLRVGADADTTKGDMTYLCQIILNRKPIDGDMAESLNQVARKKHQGGNPTPIHKLFGLSTETSVPQELILHSALMCDLGPKLQSATIQCYLHARASSIQAIYKDGHGQLTAESRTRAKSLLSKPLTPEECQQLATRILGAVRFTSLKVGVLKNSVGQQKDATEEGVLPLTSEDSVALKFKCNKSAYIYAFWIGSSGTQIEPIFPWLPSSGWSDPKAHKRDQPRSGLELTDAYKDELPQEQRQFRSRGSPGAELLLVLAHRTSLDREKLKAFIDGFHNERLGPIAWRSKHELELLNLKTGLVSKTANLGYGPDPRTDVLDQIASWFSRLPMAVDDSRGIVIPTLGGK